jgi:hypothetical protein
MPTAEKWWVKMEGLKVEKKPETVKASSPPKHKPVESQAKEMDYLGSAYKSPESFAPLLGKLSHPANMTPRIQFFSQLQRSYGNRYVQRMVQTKLKVGKPGDIYEKEADRVAEQVMRKEADEVSVSNEARPSLMGYAGEEDGVSEGTIRSIESQRGKGQPLSASSRAFFEPRFGYDFGQVRLHTDSRAADMAASLGARAFTYGSDVWLGRGESLANKKLLAHELTHVVQQESSISNNEKVIFFQALPECDISHVKDECSGATDKCLTVSERCGSEYPTEEDIDRLIKRYEGYKTSGRPYATANLEHWLGNTGTTKVMDVKPFKEDEATKKKLVDQREIFLKGVKRRLNDGEISFGEISDWIWRMDTAMTYSGDLFYAVGGYTLCSWVRAIANPIGDESSGRVKVEFKDWLVQAFDCYNWDPEKVVFFAADWEACCIENAGRAEHFFIESERWENDCAESLAPAEITLGEKVVEPKEGPKEEGRR